MCEDFKVDLLTKIPIDPELLQACDSGKCYLKEFPNKETSSCFAKIANRIIDKSNNKEIV